MGMMRLEMFQQDDEAQGNDHKEGIQNICCPVSGVIYESDEDAMSIQWA